MARLRQEVSRPLRRVRYLDPETGKTFIFLTNNFTVPAHVVAELYRCRWQIELFFKWIKQHLRIKSFYGPSENAVKTQIWIAVAVYVLIAIVKKRLALKSASTQSCKCSASPSSRKSSSISCLPKAIPHPRTAQLITN